MTFVPGFSHDVFISYTHLDNAPDENGICWVSKFRENFDRHLKKRLGSDDVSVFFDASSLRGHQELATLIENAQSSAIFISVLSRAYIARDWTINELTAFNEAVKQGNPALANINRIVAIEILPFEENPRITALLAGPKGMGIKRTRFYYRDAETQIDYTLQPSNSDSYGKSIAELAENCVTLLRELKSRAAPPAPAPAPGPTESLPLSGKTVLLAQSTDDLYDESVQVRSYLEQFGAKVLPDGDYPGGGPDFAKAMRADLEHANLFVQLLSQHPSKRPSDLRQGEVEQSQSYSMFQYVAAKRASVPTLQWHRPDINTDLITHYDKQLLTSSDVRVMGLQEFLKEIMATFKRMAEEDERKKRREREERQRQEDRKRTNPENVTGNGAQEPVEESAFFINAYDDDLGFANLLLQAFQEKRRNAFLSNYKGSAKEKDEEIDANWINCDGLLLVFGEAPAHWVRAQLRRYIKLAGQRDKPPRYKKLLLAPGAQPDELGVASNFEQIDCTSATPDVIQKFVGELCLTR